MTELELKDTQGVRLEPRHLHFFIKPLIFNGFFVKTCSEETGLHPGSGRRLVVRLVQLFYGIRYESFGIVHFQRNALNVSVISTYFMI